MEINAASVSAMQQGRVLSAVGTRVARMSLDQAQSQGEAAVSLLRAAAEVARETTEGAVAAGRENGLGGRLDVRG